MIKFFRHIRKAMINEYRVSKYLLYAIGEIVLVVIGILIALQINNWNNDRQLKDQEQECLTSLKKEFSLNLDLLNQSMEDVEIQKQNIEALLQLFDPNVIDNMSDSTIASKLYPVLGGYARYYPSTGVLTDVTSSGKLNLIQNEELRQNLAAFGNTLDWLKSQENGTIILMTSIKNFFHQNASIRKVMMSKGITLSERSISDSVGYQNLFQSVEFENLLLDHYLVTKSTNGSLFFLRIKGEIEQILAAIDQELAK